MADPFQNTPTTLAYMTPAQIASMRDYANLLTGEAFNSQKDTWGVSGGISSPWQGVSRMTDAIMGGLLANRANELEKVGARRAPLPDPSSANPVTTLPITPAAPTAVAPTSSTPPTTSFNPSAPVAPPNTNFTPNQAWGAPGAPGIRPIPALPQSPNWMRPVQPLSPWSQ